MRYTPPMRIFVLTLALLSASPALADPPAGAVRLSQSDALACAAARYLGEPLRLREKHGGRLQELRWRTPAGNVLRIDITGPACRFVAVDGVGQSDALIRPGVPRTSE